MVIYEKKNFFTTGMLIFQTVYFDTWAFNRILFDLSSTKKARTAQVGTVLRAQNIHDWGIYFEECSFIWQKFAQSSFVLQSLSHIAENIEYSLRCHIHYLRKFPIRKFLVCFFKIKWSIEREYQQKVLDHPRCDFIMLLKTRSKLATIFRYDYIRAIKLFSQSYKTLSTKQLWRIKILMLMLMFGIRFEFIRVA